MTLEIKENRGQKMKTAMNYRRSWTAMLTPLLYVLLSLLAGLFTCIWISS